MLLPQKFRFRFYLKPPLAAWFSAECAVTKKMGGEKGLKHHNAHQMEADSGHYLSLSAVLLLYPLGLTADSC